MYCGLSIIQNVKIQESNCKKLGKNWWKTARQMQYTFIGCARATSKKNALKEGAKHLLEVCKVMNCFFPHSNAILGSMVDLQCFF